MQELNPPIPEFQQNVKILLSEKKEGYQSYQVVDKQNNHLFVERTVIEKETLEDTIDEINTDYCFWYRTKGFKILRKYYWSNQN